MAQPQNQISKPWYEKWWGAIILVLIAGPIGAVALWLIWRSQQPRPVKWGISVVVFLVVWYINILLFT